MSGSQVCRIIFDLYSLQILTQSSTTLEPSFHFFKPGLPLPIPKLSPAYVQEAIKSWPGAVNTISTRQEVKRAYRRQAGVRPTPQLQPLDSPENTPQHFSAPALQPQSSEPWTTAPILFKFQRHCDISQLLCQHLSYTASSYSQESS